MSEEQAQQFLYQMQMLESIASSLEQKEAAIVNFLREAMASIESIKNLSAGQEVESLVPLGLGAYAKANIANNSKILMDIGAGIAVRKRPWLSHELSGNKNKRASSCTQRDFFSKATSNDATGTNERSNEPDDAAGIS